MNVTVPLALFGWLPVACLVFALLPARRAFIVCFLLAWMFLPATGYRIGGLPDYTKVSATTTGVLLATAVFAARHLSSFRPRLLDVPMVLWCLCPLASSIANGLGAYDGLSRVLDHMMKWGIPYFLGRIYLRDLQGLHELAVLMLVGGILYVPLCLWEVRMSPQLNSYLYGFGGAGIAYAEEMGKWGSRPRVFMGTALAVGLFMTMASLVGVWLWANGALKRLWGLPLTCLVPMLVVTTILCKNLGALAVLALGLAALFGSKWLRSALPLWVLLAVAPAYMFVRATGAWSGLSLVNGAEHIHAARAASLRTRLKNENALAAKALQRPMLGWGGWGRARVYDETGRDTSITDGLWIIALGSTGALGLVCLAASSVCPAAAILLRYRGGLWLHPPMAPAVVLSVCVVVYSIDNLFNAMLNPIYIVMSGGLVTLATRGRGKVVEELIAARLAYSAVARAGDGRPRWRAGHGRKLGYICGYTVLLLQRVW